MTLNRLLLDETRLTQRLDLSGMEKLLENFSGQVEEAVRIGEAFSPPPVLSGPVEKILFIGMGGSAIGGDVIRSLVSPESAVPILVSRHYSLPPYADARTLCIFSSYSGNTEETLSAFRQGLKRKVKSLAIASGGELARLSGESGVPWIEIPKGLPPRCALGYSVFPILRILAELKLWKWDAEGVAETISMLARSAKQKYGTGIPSSSNPAKRLAEALHEKFVVAYAGTELLECAALRFRNQIEENAKAIASHHIVPEMNHNEILGWSFPSKIISQCACVFLKDGQDHERIQLRMKITREHLAKQGVETFEMASEGRSPLARLFSVIYWGDWVSFYLALLYGIDPTPVPVIEFLKKELAKVAF
jgi:glucose/mannose-6-phosphate isomerase